MVGAVLLLAASIAIERSKVDCWQTSISAYYYTPARAIFVGGLMVIGFALIVRISQIHLSTALTALQLGLGRPPSRGHSGPHGNQVLVKVEVVDDHTFG